MTTPGRLSSVIEKELVTMSGVLFFVADEAHELLKGFTCYQHDNARKKKCLSKQTRDILHLNDDFTRKLTKASYILVSGVWNKMTWDICKRVNGLNGVLGSLRWERIYAPTNQSGVLQRK